MHWDEGPAWPSAMDVQRALRRFADLGVEVQITEMDVAIQPQYNQHVEHLDNQARQYEAAALACNVVVECTKFTVWGVSDKYTWRGSATVPLLLDEGYGRKPAYDLVRAAFGRCDATTRTRAVARWAPSATRTRRRPGRPSRTTRSRAIPPVALTARASPTRTVAPRDRQRAARDAHAQVDPSCAAPHPAQPIVACSGSLGAP